MLKGKNLELRALEPEDIDLLYDWENNSLLWYLSNTVAPFSRFALEQYVLNVNQDIFSSKQLRMMIDVNDENGKKSIGSIDLFDFDPANSRAGLGVLIIKSERQKGYAGEALALMIDYCFDVLHLHQLYCNISEDNKASLRLFEKAGFNIIGHKKEWLHIKENWVDELLLQKLNKR